MKTVEALTGKSLIRANDRAREADLNRWFTSKIEELIDPDGWNLVAMRLSHEDRWGSSPDENEWRCIIRVKVKESLEPVEVTLDIDKRDYPSLVTILAEYGEGDWREVRWDEISPDHATAIVYPQSLPRL